MVQHFSKVTQYPLPVELPKPQKEAYIIKYFAAAWTMQKSHNFLYSKKFQLETDQKPVENGLVQSLTQATPKSPALINENPTI